MVNKILIRKSDRKTLHKDRRSLGMNGENLQEVLLFCLDEKVEGTGIVEVELPNGEKGMIEVERTEEGYELPVKSSLLTQTGFVKFQLRILHDDVEIFKSEIIALEVKDSINATETIPEQYPTWIDTLTNLKQDLEKSESERVSNENERISAEKTRQENFTEMQETVSNAVSNIKDLKEDYNSNAEEETKKFNDNADEKTKTFNENSDNKVAEYDKNHTDKIKEYDDNSKAKLDAYNKNDTDKTNAYNDNTVLKEKAFNDIVTESTKAFNTNVEQKETEFENLAEEKINEYNQVSAELTAKVEQVQAENKLIKEQIPSATASGNNIHIEDSSNLDFNWKINGNQHQATREGYNLLDFNVTQNSKVTVNEDGTLTINGAGGFSLNIDKLQLKAGITYYQKVELISGSISGSNINNTFLSFAGAGKWISSEIFTESSFNEDTEKTAIWINASATFDNVVIKIWANTNKSDFEQYGASPSPDYLSEVETAGSNVNEFDFKVFLEQTKNLALKRCTATLLKNGFRLTKTENDCYIGEVRLTSGYRVKVLPNTTYTISTSSIFPKCYINFLKNDNTFISTVTIKPNAKSQTFITTSDTEYLTFRFGYNTDAEYFDFVDIKIEKGTVATPYSIYGMGSVEVDVVNKSLLNIANTEETTKDGITYSIKNGILKLNGTTTSNLEIQLSKNIKIEKGKYTHSSSYIQSGLYISFDNLMYTMIRVTVGKKITFELTEDTTFKRYFIWIDKGTFLNNVEIKLQLEVGDTATDFVEHQSQTAIMPVQQEMLEGDYISDVEHHEWTKIVLDGTENWREITTNNLKRFFYEVSVASINDNNSVNCISNYFKGTSRNKLESSSGDEISVADKFLNILIKKIETKEDFKAWLKSKYDEGNPVIVYYKLVTPLNLELTPEQKAVRKTKLYTYKNITNISLSDELASIEIEYKKDLDAEHNKLQNEIDEIKQLLSTTQTSALLLDNLQKEVESEVE